LAQPGERDSRARERLADAPAGARLGVRIVAGSRLGLAPVGVEVERVGLAAFAGVGRA
jgi:hypothetical protein